jgi:hypothetical protein
MEKLNLLITTYKKRDLSTFKEKVVTNGSVKEETTKTL